jgi:glutathione S-transferase
MTFPPCDPPPPHATGEKVRLAFHLGGIPFEDARVAFPDWPALKPTTPYGQLPLLSIDGAPPMAQSDAMLRYAGRLATDNGVPLYPRDAASELAIDEAMGMVQDLVSDWSPVVLIGMNPAKLGHPEDLKGSDAHPDVVKALRTRWMAESFPARMEYIAKRVESGGFLVGDTVTIADCVLVPALGRFTAGTVDFVDLTAMDAFPAVKAYVERFLAIPAVKAYYAAAGSTVVL